MVWADDLLLAGAQHVHMYVTCAVTVIGQRLAGLDRNFVLELAFPAALQAPF